MSNATTAQITSQINSLQEHTHALEYSAAHIPQTRRAIIDANKRAVEAHRNTLPYAGDNFNADALLARHLADIGHDLEDCDEAIKILRKKSPTQFFEIETLRERLLDQRHSEERINRDKRGAAELTPAQKKTLEAMHEESRQDERDAAELAQMNRCG